MLLGAFGVLVTGQISPVEAACAINIDVILFLFGIFIIGQALEVSGYLSYLSYRVFSKADTLNKLVLCVMLVMGASSAILMNDTLAIIGTPVVLSLARKTNMQPKILLLSLAFAVTIGSVTSPIGNPQNLLIALNGNITNPFVVFFKVLLIPTVLNLFVAYLILRFFNNRHFHTEPLLYQREPIVDDNLAKLTRASLILLFSMVLVKIVTVFTGFPVEFKLTYIALISALPVVLLSRRRFQIIRHIDWYTLVFFISMFILTESVWNSGFFQGIMASMQLDLSSVSIIMIVSVLLSQLISNVPLVALYLPILTGINCSSHALMALAAGSTIAGNLTILGAASNVIIIQKSERDSGITLTFWDFIRIGAPLTVINCVIYWVFLTFLNW
jgi:Na+/H+ antiporter NhaD/arsenite permease-like protein